ISEIMNQMVGSASTALSNVLMKTVNISPPRVKRIVIGDEDIEGLICHKDVTIKISFSMEIEGVLSSELMQIMPYSFGKQLAGGLLKDVAEEEAMAAPAPAPQPAQAEAPAPQPPPPPAAPPQRHTRHERPAPVKAKRPDHPPRGDRPRHDPTPPRHLGTRRHDTSPPKAGNRHTLPPPGGRQPRFSEEWVPGGKPATDENA
ncbi:MAG: chemotaxis protein CheC, partial [Kiritimatiellaeota bacterium]|nr:chemotaxis protein CheC [Kiritimatiellota bacterium]